jgi:hypothetical protein
MEAQESTTLRAVIRRQPVKTERAVVNCKVRELATALPLHVIPNSKSAVNPITNPNPVCNHTLSRDNIHISVNLNNFLKRRIFPILDDLGLGKKVEGGKGVSLVGSSIMPLDAASC